jgi:hypothetical protein
VGSQNPGWSLDANVATTEVAVVLTAVARKNVLVLT